MSTERNDDFEKKRLTELAKRKALLESIFDETEKLTQKQLEERTRAREAEPIALLGEGRSTSIKEWKEFIAANKQPYVSHFGYEKPFYKSIYRLNNWPEELHRKFVKDRKVAHWTNRLVYGRFPSDVLPYLKAKNEILFAYVR